MKIALDWIAEFLDRPLTAPEAQEALIQAGLPIESVEPFGSTQVLDVEVTSNRTDCFSHLGLARELSVLRNRAFKPLKISLSETQPPLSVPVNVEDPAACPFYSARVLENLQVGPSPRWLVERLESIGLRSINNVVDITNYVLMETGQPLHAFDLDKLCEQRIVVRRAQAGEKITTLDGRTHQLNPSMLVIADAQVPVAIAGIMGGEATQVTASTRRVLLESARFDPLTIRTTARALTLMSDSSFRFERGIDPAAAALASDRAAMLMMTLAGATLRAGRVCVGSTATVPRPVELRLSRITRILGIEIPRTRVEAILAALGLSPEAGATADLLICQVPTFRRDLGREIDLIEEVARVYGYDKVPLQGQMTHVITAVSVAEQAENLIRQTLTGAGWNEVLAFSFVEESEAKAFLSTGTTVKVRDAVRKASNLLRPSLLPSLLGIRRTNQNAGEPEARIFETAETFWQEGDPLVQAPSQRRMVGILASDLTELRGVIDLLMERLNPGLRVQVRVADRPWFAAGGAGELLVERPGQSPRLFGTLGLIQSGIQKQYDLRKSVAGAELFWDVLEDVFEPVRRARPLPRFPGIRRDLSVVVAEAVRWNQLEASLAEAKLAFLEKIEFVGTFRHAQLLAGKKSVTLTMEFRDPASTLRADQVEPQVQRGLEVLKAACGAELRV